MAEVTTTSDGFAMSASAPSPPTSSKKLRVDVPVEDQKLPPPLSSSSPSRSDAASPSLKSPLPPASPPHEHGTRLKTNSLPLQQKQKQEEEKQHKQELRQKKKQKKEQQRLRRLCRDSISVSIPLHVTADLKVVLERTRAKRIAKLQQAFPEIVVKQKKQSADEDDDDDEDGALEDDHDQAAEAGVDNKNANDEDKKKSKSAQSIKGKKSSLSNSKKKKNKPVVSRSDFANTIEYLEAKYVQGVMFDQDEQGQDGGDVDGDDGDDDDSEGAGSVYSQTSFLDDDELQRTVAQQVVAQQVATKVSLKGGKDDDEFFVNVGKLEVEESEMTHENYDPLQDTNKTTKSKPKTTRKRKKQPSAADATAITTTTTKGKSPKAGSSLASASAKKKVKTAPASAAAASAAKKAPASPKKKRLSMGNDGDNDDDEKVSPSAPKKKKKKLSMDNDNANENAKPNKQKAAQDRKTKELEDAVESRKAVVDDLYETLSSMIKHATPQELPRRKTHERVVLTCPVDKKSGDQITFSNPHIAGQRLRCKIPKNTQPGGTFKVTVPVPPPSEEEIAKMADPNTDFNKLTRPFHDALDDYARAYDDSCDALGALYKHMGINSEYTAHLEKRRKFDKLMAEFPKDLKTVVDLDYMKKLLRRARQNRSKRGQSQGTTRTAPASAAAAVEKKTKATSPVVPPQQQQQQQAKFKTSTLVTRTIALPQLVKTFATKKFDQDDFQL